MHCPYHYHSLSLPILQLVTVKTNFCYGNDMVKTPDWGSITQKGQGHICRQFSKFLNIHLNLCYGFRFLILSIPNYSEGTVKTVNWCDTVKNHTYFSLRLNSRLLSDPLMSQNGSYILVFYAAETFGDI